MPAMSADSELAKLQALLVSADEAIVDALDARVDTVRALLEFRAHHPDAYVHLDDDGTVIRRVVERARSLPIRDVESVYREILGANASLEAERRVAYVGDRGGFAELAARAHFGRAATLTPQADVSAALGTVARGEAAFAVLPLETSTEGAVTATLNGLATSEVSIRAERTVAARYHLLSQTGNLRDIEKVYGSAAALAACERYLHKHLANATLLDVASASVAAELASADHGAAALSVETKVAEFDLRPVEESVQNEQDGATRFAIVGLTLPSRTGRDRTVIAMAVGDRPGSLHASLAPFADRGINLTRLESRPAHGGDIRYRFFVEMDGHVTDRQIMTALDRVRELCPVVKVLGSYPRPE